MDGPSLPSGIPHANAKRLPATSAAAELSHLTRNIPRADASASGIPLPFDMGQRV